jgi:hypothetical protein
VNFPIAQNDQTYSEQKLNETIGTFGNIGTGIILAKNREIA